MKPVLTVAFDVKAGDYEFKEENISLHDTAELFQYVAPGGGCEAIPDDVEEIRMTYLPLEHRNTKNPIADLPSMLQLHMVVITGPLAEITQTLILLQDKAGRGELSQAFLRVMGIRE